MRVVPPALALVALLGLGTADATTLFVPAGYPTIQDAVDAAQSGDVIKVSKGVYAPFAVVGKSSLTIKGKRKAVVDGASVAAVVVHIRNAERITLDRLTIRFAADRGVDIDGSQSITIRRCTITDAYDGLRAHASSNVLVERNRFRSIENDAVDFSDDDAGGPAHDSQIRKNRFRGIGAYAIEIEGTNNLAEKNRVRDTGGIGIALLEDAPEGATVRKNRLKNTGDDGIAVKGSGHLVEKNRVTAAGDEGISVEASGCTLRANTVQRAGENGIEVDASVGAITDNLFERNRVTGSVRYGFAVLTGGNTFRRNAASQSGVADLFDAAGAGANVYEKNRFGSEEMP